MKQKLKQIASILLVLVLFAVTPLGDFAGLNVTAGAATNYASKVGSVMTDFNGTYYSLVAPGYNTYYPWECVWYACGRAEEKAGQKISGLRSLGNGNTWYTNTTLSKDSTLKCNSIACYSGQSWNGYYGHVIYIEHISGNTVYYTEANVDGGISDNLKSPSDGVLKIADISAITGKSGYVGAIYLDTYINESCGSTSDTTSPVITEQAVSSIYTSSMGYYITCKITDNVGVDYVRFPSWGPGQTGGDALWFHGAYDANSKVASCYIPITEIMSDPPSGTYTTHIYAYDTSGNYSAVEVTCNITMRTVPANATAYNIGNGVYTLQNATGGYMTVKDGTDANKVNVLKAPYDGTSKQQFRVVHQNNGTYLIYAVSSSSNRVLDVLRGENTTDTIDQGDVIDIYSTGDNEAQLFYAVRLGNGLYALELVSKDNYVIGAYDASGASSNLYLQKYVESSSLQKWYFCDTAGNVVNPAGLTNLSDCTFSSVSAQTYTGAAITPAVTVKYGPITLVKDTDYTVAYSNNTNAGTAAITITGKGKYSGTKTINFKINAKSISGLTISAIADQTYTSGQITPAVTVKNGSTTLTNGTHYTVAYSNNINVGTATVTITGKGNYTGTKTATFKIVPKNISGFTISSIADQTYTGSAITPSITFKNGTYVPVKGTDYTVSYSNNINAGTATVTVIGKGNLTGTKTTTFKINPKEITNFTISAIADQTYTGSAITPAITVKNGTYTPEKGTHYTVSYSNNVNVGTATVTITGIGNFTGTKTATFKIVAKAASNFTVSSIGTQYYTGSAITPAVTVKDGSTTLTNGTHYTVSYSNNVNAGTATVTITGKGNYSGTKTVNFTIAQKPISAMTFSDIAAQTYTGSAITPTVTVKHGSTTLVNGTHYTLSYSNNINVGQATLVVTGKGNYSGIKTLYFDITAKSISSAIISTIADQTYTGSAIKPAVTVKDGSKTLVSGTDYTVAYSNNTNIGTATVTITGKGNYTGTKTITFNIVAPPVLKPEITVVAGEGSVTITWNAVTGATNYKVFSYLNKKYTELGTTTSTRYTATGLTGGTKYGFLVRALVNGAWTSFTNDDVVYATPTAPAVTKPVVTATAGTQQVALKWNAVTGATSYNVYSYLNSKYTLLTTTTSTSYTATGLTGGTKYGFLVRALVNGAWTTFTNDDVVYATPTAPAVTKPVVTATAGAQQVKLTWNAVTGATSYNVYIYTNGYKLLTTTTATSYTATGLTAGTKYGFLVRALVNGTWTTFTNADLVYATPTAPAVTKPVVTATAGTQQVALKWNAVTGATSYNVYSYLNSKYTLLTTTTSTSYTATGLTGGTKYGFLVRALVNGAWTTFTTADNVYATPTVAATKPVLTITPMEGEALIRWGAISGATNYRVFTYLNGKYTEIGTTTSTSYIVSDLTSGTEYGFLVRAYVNGAWTSFSTDDLVYEVVL